ncbi:MAG: hypothetical protein HKM23_05870 [Nitrosopumilus sp.]|nr:hypothetical protein [Nitrosopumilus sp.]
MLTATHCKSIKQLHLPSGLVREERENSLPSLQIGNPDIVGLSCLIIKDEFEDITYQNERRCY